MKLSDFDFDLPPDQIAQYPAPVRDESRLLVLDRNTGAVAHRRFSDLVDYLTSRDVLVLNRTRVMRARLHGVRNPGGGNVELLLIRPAESRCQDPASPSESATWLAMGRPGRRLRIGTRVEFAGGELACVILAREKSGRLRVRFEGADVSSALAQYGQVPLPPYIRREPEALDVRRYQTVFADEAGAVAAPTAGLHFTGELLERIASRGTGIVRVLLHVGPGTFVPVRCEDPREHVLEPEYCELDEESADVMRACRSAGGRIVAVGTTVVRTLETAAEGSGQVEAWRGWSAKFICPPYEFSAVDALVTNFHLPRSSLLLLTSAFAGRERLLRAYAEAVEKGYRFYSYGDAMLIL